MSPPKEAKPLYGVYTIDFINEVLTGGCSWRSYCQHPNGGFGERANLQPHVQYTYHAIMLLKELGSLDRIDKNKHAGWIKSLQNTDGGFSNIPGQQSHVTNTYFAIGVLDALGSLDQIDKNKVVEFLISCQNPNGGFAHLPNHQPHPQYTYHAIFLLKKFGNLDRVDVQRHVNWLKSLQRPDGGFWPGTGQEQSQIAPTYFAVKALMELDELNHINLSKLIEFVLSLQHQNGGFRNLIGQPRHVHFTCFGVELLQELQTFISELLNKYLQELEEASGLTKVSKLVEDILNVISDEKLADSIKEEVEKLKGQLRKGDVLEKILGLIPRFVYFDAIDIIGDYISLTEYLENKRKI